MCCKYVEMYLQSLVTTNVFLGLQTFHLELSEMDKDNQLCLQLDVGTCM